MNHGDHGRNGVERVYGYEVHLAQVGKNGLEVFHLFHQTLTEGAIISTKQIKW
jgi:hypothetical protein